MEEVPDAHFTWYYNTYKDILEQMANIIDHKYANATEDELVELMNGGDAELFELQNWIKSDLAKKEK